MCDRVADERAGLAHGVDERAPVRETGRDRRREGAAGAVHRRALDALALQPVDLDRLASLVTKLELRSARLLAFAFRLSPTVLRVDYEDLVTSPGPAYGRVFDYVGASEPPDSFDYTAGFTKVLPNDLESIVLNFDELEAHPLLHPYVLSSNRDR